MLNWQVGAVKITSVVEITISFPEGVAFMREATPEALQVSPGSFHTSPRRMVRSSRWSNLC
jgi:hypothetical protein